MKVQGSKNHPEIRSRYLRIKKRHGHRKAIIAIARTFLTTLYHMLKNGENYNTELYQKSNLTPSPKTYLISPLDNILF